MQHLTAAERMVPLVDYQAERPHVFPSMASLRWFMRQNRPELVNRGALISPTGRHMVVVDRFDSAVVDIGARRLGRQGQEEAAA